MLTIRQIIILVLVAVAFWIVGTAYIHWLPGSFLSPVRGAISFATTLPIGWLSILFARRMAGLAQAQLLPGLAVVGATAMMIDALVLRWAPLIYGDNDTVLRNGAAWLLWGYGVSLAITLIMAAPRRVRVSAISTARPRR